MALGWPIPDACLPLRQGWPRLLLQPLFTQGWSMLMHASLSSQAKVDRYPMRASISGQCLPGLVLAKEVQIASVSNIFSNAFKNNELLLKNHESRPTGASPFPEVNATQCLNNMPRFYRGRGRGQGSGRGFGRGRGMNRGRGADRGRGRGRFVYYRQGYFNEQESNRPMKRPQNDIGQSSKKNEDKCYRCGMTGHWFRNCRSNSYFVELYQNSLKQKNKVPEKVKAPENVNPS
ncbi:uncharacterized protein LOC127262892 [Andrographis paniculata]|uniref:uncharacterized protein LOC127262892 n=1 Tax=Andrographis paniculata TaxID=175694 RepID=UPI0021E842CF|nr:uncharacterized protein LOC127262892 [Andrographis paniculata]